jgi:hypothetical protein
MLHKLHEPSLSHLVRRLNMPGQEKVVVTDLLSDWSNSSPDILWTTLHDLMLWNECLLGFSLTLSKGGKDACFISCTRHRSGNGDGC